MKKFENYISQYSEEELKANFEEIVRKFNQIPENKNKFVKPIPIGKHSLIGGGTFEEYKEEYQKRINTDLSNKDDIKNYFQKSVILKMLKVDTYKAIYESLKSGGSDRDIPEYFFAKNYWKLYLYFTKKHTVEELIKFESFLNDIKSKTVTESPQIEFKDFFQDEAGYNKVIKRLAEKEYINPETVVWIDYAKGYKWLSAGLLKYLHSIGYLKVKMTNDEIQNILKNTFKIDVSLDSIKKAKSDNPIFEKLKL